MLYKGQCSLTLPPKLEQIDLIKVHLRTQEASFLQTTCSIPVQLPHSLFIAQKSEFMLRAKGTMVYVKIRSKQLSQGKACSVVKKVTPSFRVDLLKSDYEFLENK